MQRRLTMAVLCLSLTCGGTSSHKGGETPSGTGGDSGGGGAPGNNGGSTGSAGKPGTPPPSGGSAGSSSTGGNGGAMAGGGRAGNGGMAGANGNGGAGGMTMAGGSGGMPAAMRGNSVLERNNHPSRDGLFVQAGLTKAKAATFKMDANFKASFMGNMWASPLYLEDGPGGKGVFFAVTTGNDVFALDEATGAVVWKANLGPSPMQSGAGCGSIHPIGILSTPVIDAKTRTIYIGAAIGGAAIERHEVHALSVDDGKPRMGWPVDVGKALAGKFNVQPQNQRSALSLLNGILYVAYGGHVGDCGPYRGWVVAISTANPTQVTGWSTGGVHEGIWPAGGMASDGTNIFASTGNGNANMHADSEEVVRLTGMATVDRTTGVYWPKTWRAMDGGDQDMSSSNPVYVEVPGATPPAFVVAPSKDGHLFFLDPKKLGSEGGELIDFQIAAKNAPVMAVRATPTVYTTAKGVHVALTIDRQAICPNNVTGQAVLAVFVPPGAPPKPEIAWCAPINGQSAPITTTTDGKAETIVWYVSGGSLVGVDGETGAQVYRSMESCSGVRQWTSPIAVKGRIIVGGDGHLCAFGAP